MTLPEPMSEYPEVQIERAISAALTVELDRLQTENEALRRQLETVTQERDTYLAKYVAAEAQ
ncbi:hypothetical protein E2F47_27475 [Mycobacterium eburneum]|nr:hypothetical protein [Mycobacterium eburneum]TDH46001.1 hypothetical protein E2F47_27475 [Mycobacterium eburneum]